MITVDGVSFWGINKKNYPRSLSFLVNLVLQTKLESHRFYQQKMPYAMLGCEAHLKINQNAIWKAFKNTLNSQQLHPIFDVSPLCMECLDNHRRKSLEWVVERESWSPVKALCWLAFSNGSPSDTVPSGRIDWDIGQTRLLGFDFQGSPVCLVVVKETISIQQVIGHLMQDRK